MIFKSLHLDHWRQFETVDLDFHPRLTILTGANGSGKTTILNILSRHFGWQVPFVSTPVQNKLGKAEYSSGLWDQTNDARTQNVGDPQVGTLHYTQNRSAILRVPGSVSPEFQIIVDQAQQIPGVNIPSHRPVFNYSAVGSISAEGRTREQASQQYRHDVLAAYRGQHHRPVILSLKESIVSLAAFGYGNEAIARNEDAIATYEGFQRVLKKVLPRSLGFDRFRIVVPEILLETATGNFSLDAVSGGVAAIIDVAWQIFSSMARDSEFVVVIDEPENHLHPKMQREILPDLLDAFPQCQFIVATHNPLIVSSVSESAVYVLDYNEVHRVYSRQINLTDKSGTANEILRQVLGVDVSSPLWVEETIKALVAKYAAQPLDAETLAQFKSDLARANLSRLFPDFLPKLLTDRETT